MTKFKEKYEASDAFVQKRPAPKSKGWYSIVENGILVTKPRTNKTAAEKRARKNKGSFWLRRTAVV